MPLLIFMSLSIRIAVNTILHEIRRNVLQKLEILPKYEVRGDGTV